jgi:deoxyribodipyrimidine photo-lyase
MIQETRIQPLNQAPIRQTSYVLYWMQQSQRVNCNHALEYAIRQANELALPVVVGFGLMTDYPDANERHYAFMLQGLAEVAERLNERGIKFVIRLGRPDEVALQLGQEAALIVADRGYLRHQKAWRERVAIHAQCRVVQVETDVVVPVAVASGKREFGARTLRPKLHKCWEAYLQSVGRSTVSKRSSRLAIKSDRDCSGSQETYYFFDC